MSFTTFMIVAVVYFFFASLERGYVRRKRKLILQFLRANPQRYYFAQEISDATHSGVFTAIWILQQLIDEGTVTAMPDRGQALIQYSIAQLAVSELRYAPKNVIRDWHERHTR